MVATIPGALSGMSAVIPTSLKLPMTFKYWAAVSSTMISTSSLTDIIEDGRDHCDEKKIIY